MFIRHATIEKNVILMVVLTLITVSIGGLVQIIPLFTIESTIERVDGVRPYTPLEVLGRNVYIREGCYLCHSVGNISHSLCNLSHSLSHNRN